MAAVVGTRAVFEALPENTAIRALKELVTDASFAHAELTLTVARESVVIACKALQSAGYNFLEDVTAVDWYPSEPRFQIVYHILSFSRKERVRLVFRLDGDSPSLDTSTAVW